MRPAEVCGLTTIDRLDADLLRLLGEDPRRGVVDLAMALDVTRNTVQSRLARLRDSGVLQGFVPQLDLTALGLHVHAFLNLELAQGALEQVLADLRRVPSVLEVLVTTGTSDLTVRTVTATHEGLQSLIQDVLALPGVRRTTTVIALSTPVPYRVDALLEHHTRDVGRGRSGR